MRILVLADRIVADPWPQAGLATEILRELVSRGHLVTLACDSAEEPVAITDLGIVLHQKSSFCYRKWSKPARLRAWLERADTVLAPRHDAVLSLTWLATGGVWMPVGPAAATRLTSAASRFVRRSGMPRMLCSDAVYADTRSIPSLLARTLVERLARTHADRLARTHSIIVHSPAAAQQAEDFVRTASSAWEPARRRPRVLTTCPCGASERPMGQTSTMLRRITREMLGIGQSDTVALLPRIDRISSHVLPVFEAAAKLRAPVGPLTLLVVCPDPYAVRQAAELTGAADRVVVAAPSRRFEALLLACDLGILASPPHPQPFFAGSAHRAAADLLRRSRPILCRQGTPEAELVGQVQERAAGIVVPSGEVAAWHRALTTAADPSWRISAGVTARATADVRGLCPRTLADALEAALADSAVAMRPVAAMERSSVVSAGAGR